MTFLMKRIYNLSSLPIALALALLAGCASASRTTTDTGDRSGSDSAANANGAIERADLLLAGLRRSYESTPMLSLNGDMKISGIGATVWFDALVRGRDSLRINLVGPFGVPVGALSATRDQFLFFNAQEGEAIEGIPDRETFGKLMQLELEYNEMISMLRGELPRIPEPGSYQAEERDDMMHYTVRTARGVESFTIDIDEQAVTGYRRMIGSGSQAVEEFSVTYRDFQSLGDRKFPKRASVSIANGAQKVAVTVEKLRNRIDDTRSCALDLPPGIERKRL